MGIDNNLGHLLQHLAGSLARQSDQLLQDCLGSGYSQFKILRVLEQNPNIKQRAIAQDLGQTEASISRQIKLLVERGLLSVTISPKNRREHITALTSRGDKLTQEAVELFNNLHAPLLDSLSSKQQEQFAPPCTNKFVGLVTPVPVVTSRK